MAKYIVELSDTERAELHLLVKGGNQKVRDVKRAQILLASDAGATDEEIIRAVQVSSSTVFRTRQQFVEEGLNIAIHDRPRPGANRKFTGKEEALLIATVCAEPPPGRARWTLELVAGEFVRLTGESISRETVRRKLHDNELKPWLRQMWCVPSIDADFVMRMENVIDLYIEQPTDDEPVVCLDESPVQLIGETRPATRIKRGRKPRHDYEYKRHGTANLFVMMDAHKGWRHVEVTDQHTAIDFAHCLKQLVDDHYSEAKLIHLVLDNYAIHTPSALYKAFAPEEARRIARRLRFHYTPKHASWLNMAEIEIGVLKRQCLARRIPDKSMMASAVRAWQAERNKLRAKVDWMFDLDKARTKMGRSYPGVPIPLERSEAA